MLGRPGSNSCQFGAAMSGDEQTLRNICRQFRVVGVTIREHKGIQVDDQPQSQALDGGAEEWLRRIAVGRSMATVPNPIAFALVAMGFAQKTASGQFEATEVGRAYLDAQGIAWAAAHRDRAGPRRRYR
jgi:hypothetical protein